MTELTAVFAFGFVLGIVLGVCIMWDRREIDFHDDTEHGARPL